MVPGVVGVVEEEGCVGVFLDVVDKVDGEDMVDEVDVVDEADEEDMVDEADVVNMVDMLDVVDRVDEVVGLSEPCSTSC
jgi:hypothetical protein